MELTKERINEIAYAMFLQFLGKQDVKLDPNNNFWTGLRNLDGDGEGLIPVQFREISSDELNEVLALIIRDLAEYAVGGASIMKCGWWKTTRE